MSTHAPVRLQQLEVRRFRHVAEPVVLELGEGPVLLIGRNGTGKTNLLRLVDAVTRLDFSAFENDPDGIDISFRLRWGDLTLTMELVCDPPPKDLEGPAEVRTRFSGRAVGAAGQAVDFEVGPGGFRGGHAIGTNEERPDPFDSRFRNKLTWLLASGKALDDWLIPLYPTHLTLTESNGRFDEALASFEVVTTANGHDHAVLLISDGPERRGSSMSQRMVPWAIAEAYFFREAAVRLEPLGAEEIAWFGDAATACGFEALDLQAAPPREDRISPNQVHKTYSAFTWYAERGSSRFPHHDFSFGQKRIVAAFWHLACVRDFGGAFVADELVNGLHHEALSLILERLHDLQAFLASQNPLLFDYMEYSSTEDFRKRIVRCDPHPNGWTWRNPTKDEAERFVESYEAGIQHVSEILRTEGLW